MEESARRICSFSMGELIGFNAGKDTPLVPSDLIEMCFRATFITSFLIDGFGFPRDYVVEAANVINGQKVGWALGSMLYEVCRCIIVTWERWTQILTRMRTLTYSDCFNLFPCSLGFRYV